MIEHLYIHIPFCHRVCPYCSFYKHTPGKIDQSAFVDALLLELLHYQNNHSFQLKSIYFGGGTPSMLSPRLLEKLFDGLKRHLDWQQLEEISFEANPATFTQKKAQQFVDLGINRVTLGVQSWDNSVLKTLGREHSPDQARKSFELLREVGMPQIGIDLMFAIPGQSLSIWEESLRKTLELRPEHFSAYNLTYEEDTDFFEKLQAGQWHQDPEQDAPFFDLASDLSSLHGYTQYETSNFCLPSGESKHNLAYWKGRDYLGLGPGAVSTIEGWRWQNVANTEKYIYLAESRGFTKKNLEEITPEAWRLERVALLLRTQKGVPTKYLKPNALTRVQELIFEELVNWNHDFLQTTPKGRLLVDSIVSFLEEHD